MKSAALRALESQVESALAGRVLSPFSVRERHAPQPLPTGVRAIDALTGGLPRGALTEICGPASSGRTSLLLAVLAEVTGREEICALVDAGDAFDPQSAAAAGVRLQQLLWVRCSAVEQALKAADLLLQAGGFGLVAVDLGDVPPQTARRVPLTSWFRFRRAVENTPGVLLVLEQEPFAKSCASLVLRMQPAVPGFRPSVNNGAQNLPTHARLLRGFSMRVEVQRSRMERKPVRSDTAAWENTALWAG